MKNLNTFLNVIFSLSLLVVLLVFSNVIGRNKNNTAMHSDKSAKDLHEVVIDIGKVQNYFSNSTGYDETFIIGRDDAAFPSMAWLEGGYPLNHYLYYGTFRIGYNNDYIRFSTQTSNDWVVYQNDSTQVSPFDVHFSMTDDSAGLSLVGVNCLCKIHAWSDTTRDDFYIIEYHITNNSAGILADVYTGFHVDGDLSAAAGGSGLMGYYRDDMMDYYLGTDINGHPESISYMYDGDNPDIPGDDTGGRLTPKESLGFLGSRVLDCPANKHGISANQQSGHQWWDWNNDPYTGNDWYSLMALEQFKGDTNVFHDYKYFQTMGPWDIDAGDTLRIALAFGIGEGLTGLRENLQTAYDLYWSDVRPTNIATMVNGFPKDYTLYQNFPNPFNPVATISYSMKKSGFVNLKIYDILGREIENMVNQFQKANTYTIKFDGSKLSSGIYFYQLQIGKDYSEIKKMILMR